ncbi:LuxR C-terminal-related transcriptional regulator [Streptomyces sp. ISL-86]|uniref:helix-turn-helix transcriptional regulator n=1 Tax=Streptomyces sp. ISL-86 TaxID=2819187 RepID=UPI001BE916C8|nr:LuxR C-terminal-related transcriptional regulator [Streptomyces sp. ISL-86]MBT2455557.1 hypothetical protein [Streptomyces sp. ISL-86]
MASMSSGAHVHRPGLDDARHRDQHELMGRLRAALDSLDALTDVLPAMAVSCCEGLAAGYGLAPESSDGGNGGNGGNGDGDGEGGAGEDVFAELRDSARFELLEVRPALPAGRTSGAPAHHRLIVGASAAESPGAAARISAVTGRGALVRTVGLLPLHLAVADRENLVVALDLGDGPTVPHTIRTPATAREVARRFLQDWWPRARPCGAGLRVPPGTLNGTEAAVIDGLAQGLTDESVARRVGVTPRTVRRHVAAVSERYGATSRLQLGLLLGRAVGAGAGVSRPDGAAGQPSPGSAPAVQG